MQDTLAISPNQFTLVTVTPVSALRLQNLSPHNNVFLNVTTNTTAPVDLKGAVELGAGDCLACDLPLHHLFPGVLPNGASGYVWVWAVAGATVSLSHA